MESKQSSNLIYKMACKILHKGPIDKQVSTDEMSERSYEDALLDVQLTSFFRSEYAKQEPPSGVFPRLVQAIRLHRERQEKLANAGPMARLRDMAGQKLAAVYRFGARADSGRVLSGGLVTALLLIAAWPSLSNTLSNGNMSTIYGTYFQAFTNTGGAQPTQRPTGELRPADGNVAPVQAAPTKTSDVGGQAVSEAGEYISPGRIYEEPLFRIEQRTGEDLTAAEPNGNADHTQLNPSGTDKGKATEPQGDQQYQRPALGQD
jgi:hypothetical protein